MVRPFVRMLPAALVILAVVGSADAYAKKNKAPPAPTVGWVPTGTGQCWVPPDFSGMAEGPKRVAWNETRDAIVGQWRGERNDGISMNTQHVENLETVVLSKPDRVETVAKENLEQCKAAMTGGGAGPWEQWVIEIAGRLTVGECPYPPMDYTLFNYLSVNADWQIPVNVCRGDKIVVHGTDGDYYQLQSGGPWLNVAGDPAQPATASLPCNIEGCFRGQLVMRFTSDSHVQQIIPIGISTEFVVPEHGRVEVMINDDSLEDNKFKVEKGLEHHTGIEIKPAGG
ncbi:MAG: hypothetical protein ABMB14_05845 [Myxococcota bacterium]